MASYVDETTLEQSASAEQIKELMALKAHELFNVCDTENKGFITKRDMQRLQTELNGLSPEQLEDVFDSLDDDGNGYLTLEEFTEGFGSFIGLTPDNFEKQKSVDSGGSIGQERIYENDHEDFADEEENFQEMLTNMGLHNSVDEMETVKALWIRLRRDEPDMLGNFEQLLHKVTSELNRTRTDYEGLESALRNKSQVHDEEIKRLYDEMETQIKFEKERIQSEDKARERQVKEATEQDIMAKDRQLQDLHMKHQEMEHKLQVLNQTETQTKQENELLAKDRDELEEMLDKSQRHLEESRTYVNQLRNQYREEKRERAMAALHISEGIAMERESLVKQLDMLREMNRKLRDDKDEAELRRDAGSLQEELEEALINGTAKRTIYPEDTTDDPDDDRDDSKYASNNNERSSRPSVSSHVSSRRERLSKQGSILSNYFDSGPKSRDPSSDYIEEDDIEIDEPAITSLTGQSYGAMPTSQSEADERRRRGQLTSDSDGDDIGLAGASRSKRKGRRRDLNRNDSGEFDITSPRTQPVGANSTTECGMAAEVEQDISSAAPERVFKVVFVGDSGVGKSSFLHQFCSNKFRSTFSATIGVDFQVKNVKVDGHVIALQLWDTAGQERFRSITKQYFRKADGVLVMYDVTSELTFKNVRNWMTSVQDGTEESTVLAIVGNKMDLVEDEDQRGVTTKDGSRLADEFGALFYETSAKSGMSVKETLHGMASLLREREDREMEKALHLTDESAKKKIIGCCS